MDDKCTGPAVKEFLEQMLVNSRWYEYAFVSFFRIIISLFLFTISFLNMTLLVASACKIQKCQIVIVDLTIDLNDKPIDLKNIAIVHIKKIAYRIYFSDMT